MFDKDDNGFITIDELKQMVLQFNKKEKLSQKELNQMLKEYDNDGDKRISFDEFLKVALDHLNDKSKYEQDLRNAFHNFDKDSNGFITRSELKETMKELGQKLNDDEIDQMLKEADINGDSKISFVEFMKLMSSK